MLIKKITLKNIRSYLDEEITFPEGSILLSGDIGSGKTSVLLGIEFALFGLQPGQKGNSLLRNDVKEGSVKILFEINGKEIEIERTLKKTKTVTQDYCSITIDGQRNELAVTQLKNVVLDLLNYPKDFLKKQNLLYRFTVYTPHEEMKQIILQDPDIRINTIRHIFGIDKYKNILENISILSSKLREERKLKEGMISNLENDKSILEIKENEIETKYYNLSSIQKELFLKTEQRKKLQEEQDENSKKIEEKKKLEQEVEKINIMIFSKNQSILDNNKLINELNQQIKDLSTLVFDESKIMVLEKEIQSNKNKQMLLNEENIKITSNINSLIIKNEESQKIREKLSHIEICPTCLQDVNSVYKTNVINKAYSDINENNKTIKNLKIEKEKLMEIIKTLSLETSEKESQISDLKVLRVKLQNIEEKRKRISDLEKASNFLKRDIDMLGNNNEVLKKSILNLKKYEILFSGKSKEIDAAMKEERSAEIKVAELKKEIDISTKQVDEIKERIKKTEEIKKSLHYLMELESWLSEKFSPMISFIEKNVMFKLKKDFSELFNKWFCMLVSENFIARIDENFTPIIEQQDYEIPYEYLSGGERTAVALAYRLSLNQIINSVLSEINTREIVILDEPTDGFSEQQLDKMREVLQQLNVKQLLLVSHEQKIESFVENIIRFKKENGVSRIEK